MKKMPAAILPVPLASVDWDDRRFAIESHSPLDDLRISIERYGILTPPWLLGTAGEKLVIVDGFKRMCLLREWGEQQVVCSVFPAHTTPQALWAWRLEARLFGPPPNPAEKAQVAVLIADGRVDASSAQRLLDGFGLPRYPDGLDRWKRLARSEPGLLEAAAAGIVHERAALDLADWPLPAGERAGLIALFHHLRCSASIQVEIVEGFRDVNMMSGRSVGSMLGSVELRGFLDREDWSPREKTRAVREWLEQLRLPRLKARERRFQEDLRRSPPPTGVKVVPPPAFEGGQWRLELTFSDVEDLGDRLARLRVWAGSDGLRALLSPREAGDVPPHQPDEPCGS